MSARRSLENPLRNRQESLRRSELRMLQQVEEELSQEQIWAMREKIEADLNPGAEGLIGWMIRMSKPIPLFSKSRVEEMRREY